MSEEPHETGFKILTSIATGVTAIVVFYKKVVKPSILKRRTEKIQREIDMEEMVQALKQIPGLLEKIEEIRQQVFPYGRGSLLEVIELRFDSIDQRLDNIEDNNIIFNNMQKVAFWISDDKGQCTYASPQLCHLINKDERQILGLNWVSYLFEKDAKRVSDEWIDSVAELRVFDQIYSFKKTDTETIKLHGFAIHKKNRKTGRYSGSIGTLTTDLI